MGVFKWLRRERVTVTTSQQISSDASTPEEQFTHCATQTGTIRTEEYKRDLAEFQARRSAGNKELTETPVKKKICGRHSLPVVSCTGRTADHDATFNYEKKSASKYKKHKRARSNTPEKVHECLPNIQFLFQNQVFMPGNIYPTNSYSEPHKVKRQPRSVSRSPDFVIQRQIDFKDDQGEQDSPPEFFKNNSLPYDVQNFLEAMRSNEEEVDGLKAAGDVKSSQSSARDMSGDDKLWEVMSELKHFDQWADEQLMPKSPNAKSDDSKSDTSAYGLPVASARNIDLNADKEKIWNYGRWGVVAVQIKKLKGVNIEQVKKKRNTEINILRKYRHPNIILLMGIYPDINNNVHIICERCVDSLFGILHIQGRILSVQTSVQYALDIANALVFLRMQGYIHTQINSTGIMVTNHDTAKLVDLGPCVKVIKDENNLRMDKNYELYSREPQYVNIEETRTPKTTESEPLLSANPSETYLKSNAVAKSYELYETAELYRWHAPELFQPNEEGMVYPCSKSDVYSLCLVLWECCNASLPFKLLTYEKLKEQYSMWKTGITLPKDGTYPGCMLSLLQSGLDIQRAERMDLDVLQKTLQDAKRDIDDLGYIIIPACLQKKKSNFSSTAWDTTSPTDSECQSPQNLNVKAVIHARELQDSSTESEKETRSDTTPLYESLKKTYPSYTVAEKCQLPDDTDHAFSKYTLLQDRDFSSACSTPIAKLRARIKDLDTPGALHRSDSTEYCSILSPNRTMNFPPNDDSTKDQSAERPTAKLSRSFTPKSYKPLHIKVPECNLDSIKPLLKDKSESERSSYNFDIKNYSLPTTPIARSNKLRKNAWLSGELESADKTKDKAKANNTVIGDCINELPSNKNPNTADETRNKSVNCSSEIEGEVSDYSENHDKSTEYSPGSCDNRNNFTGLRRVDHPQDFETPSTDDTQRWSFKSQERAKYKVDDDLLANMSVKPLVAIHERWIYEANRKAGRSMSLPENNRSQTHAVKPASHCVDTLQKSLPQLNVTKPKTFRTTPSPSSGTNGGNWEQFCQARESVAKGLNFTARDPHRFQTWKKDDKGTITNHIDSKTDQATDTKGIEEFIRDLIRKEFQYLMHEMPDHVTVQSRTDLLNKGVANVMESLNNDEAERTLRKEPLKSFSRVKINGNNKPLLQITFNRSGENSLQVLDNCVNVTICDNSSKDKLNQTLEETLVEDVQINSLKRCQAFNAIQEARSTEDLYIDDDLSTQMQENFGGKVKLIPLHGSLHEILCEKEDDCCLIKVKQENGCDTIYFRCDNSDTESRDAIDGTELTQDTVVFKRSISLIEERIQRVIPKDKRPQTPVVQRKIKREIRTRPKSEVFAPISRETRVLSSSSPSLVMKDSNEVEVNIENVMCYQDSSSDECINKCPDDDFELLEKKIEEDLAQNLSLGCGCLEKISEENLSTLNEEVMDK